MVLMGLYFSALSTVSCLPYQQNTSTDTYINVTLPTTPNCTNPTYQITIREFGSSGAYQPASTYIYSSGGVQKAFVFNLQPCTQYQVLTEVFCNGVSVGGCANGQPFSTTGCNVLDCNDVTPINITTNSAQLTIPSSLDPCRTGTNNQIAFEIQWREAGTTTWTTQNIVTTGNVAILSNLESCTEYEYRIRFECNGSFTDACSGTLTTECTDCDLLEVVFVGTDLVRLEIPSVFDPCRTGANNQINFIAEWREVGTTAWTSQNIVTPGPFVQLFPLESCTEYEYRVRFNCGGVWTDWCEGTVTTECTACDRLDVVFVTDDLVRLEIPADFDNCRTGANNQINFIQEWREVGTTVWNSQNIVTPGDFVQFFPLDACTEYEYRVSFNCGGVWTDPCEGTFTTECRACDMLDVVFVGEDLVRLEIPSSLDDCRTGLNNQINFIAEWREVGTTAWTSQNIVTPGPFVQLFPLESCTEYEYRVRFNCDGVFTEWCEGTVKTECSDCDLLQPVLIGKDIVRFEIPAVYDDCRTGANNQINFIQEWREVGTTVWNSQNIVTPGSFVQLFPLESCTEYEYRIRFNCDGILTDWCEGVVRTECDDCGITVASITDNLVQLNIPSSFDPCRTGTNNQINFIQEWREVGTTAWNSQNIVTPGPFVQLFPLDPCTEYEYRVRFNCGGVWTDWCGGTVTTTGDCEGKGGEGKGGEGGLVSGGGRKTISESSIGAEVRAYPNPFTHETKLEFSLATEQEVSITLHDMMGRQVYQYTGSFQTGTNTHAIAGEQFPSGILFYTLQTATEKVSGRLVKQ